MLFAIGTETTLSIALSFFFTASASCIALSNDSITFSLLEPSICAFYVRSTTGFNIPSIDIDYSNVARGNDAALIDAKGELLLGISAIIGLNYDWMIFSDYPVCHSFDFLYFFSCKCR